MSREGVWVHVLEFVIGNCGYAGCKHNDEGYCKAVTDPRDVMDKARSVILPGAVEVDEHKEFICEHAEPKDDMTCIHCGGQLRECIESEEYWGARISRSEWYCPVCD